MSNLYKSQINQRQEDVYTRVIDYNELLEQKLSAVTFEQQKKLRQQQIESGAAVENPDDASQEAEFSAGLLGVGMETSPELEIDYVERAKEEAQQILSKATADAEQILQKAVGEAENLKITAREEGSRQGYAEGMERAQAQADQMQAELEQQRAAQEQDYTARLEVMEAELMEVVVEVFDRVLQSDLAGRKAILLHLIRHTVQNIKNSREFRIRVSEADYADVSARREELLQRIGGEVTLDVVLDETMQQGQCTIDTDEGLFDCGLDVQLENLTKDLKTLSCMD